jgi:intraflagellar transport protein 81
MRGDPLTVYPFLHWVLEGFEKNKTRGYLARYLRPFSIPEEHFADNQIVNMYQQYQTRQSEFKEMHIQLEEVRKTASNPKALQQEVTQLENEKEQLHNKLEKLNNKIRENPEYKDVNFEEMLKVTNQLRQEQEQEAKLHQDLEEQRNKLMRAEQIRNSTARKFQEMNHSDMARADPLKLIAKLRSEVAERRQYLEEKLDGIIQERERSLKNLAKIANNSQDFTQDDVNDLLREKHDLTQDVDDLLQRRENSSASDSKVTFIRDRLAAVEKKREKLLESIAELEDEKSSAEADLKKAQAEFKQLTQSTEEATLPGGQARPKTEAQMKEYMNDLNRKTQKYKSLKAELESERTEIQILQRTEEILRSRDQNLAEFTAQQEKRLGVVGFSSAQDNLEAVSSAKASIDTHKGQFL